MIAIEIYNRLKKKINDEYAAFYDYCLTLDKKQLIEKATEIYYKENLAMCFDWSDSFLSESEAKALLSRKGIIGSLYDSWLKQDDYQMEYIQDDIVYLAKKTLERMNEMER